MDYDYFLSELLKFFGTESWIIQVFIVVFVTLFFDWLQKRVFKKLYAKLEKTRTYWDDAIVGAMGRPLSALIWIVGLTFAAEIVKQESGAAIFEAINPIRDVGVVVVITWFMVRFITRAERNIISSRIDAGEPFDRTTADAIAKLLRFSVIITAFLVALQTLGYSISGVLAFGGIGGIAIGFAAKDLLANFFGGLMIYMDRPFDVGDWIRSPDKEIEGTVENIGWRLTRIRTFDKRPLYIPNSVFANISVENPSRMTNRRIYETIGIRYEDAGKMDKIVADVKTMLREHPEIDVNQTLIVNFNKFAPSSLDFFIYTFTRTTEWIRYHEIKQDVMLKIIDIIERHGAECAFPTSTLHIATGNLVPDRSN
ncbi:MAG: mechanosensitive ion channel family protein [Gammaproteobacteria bacterium]